MAKFCFVIRTTTLDFSQNLKKHANTVCVSKAHVYRPRENDLIADVLINLCFPLQDRFRDIPEKRIQKRKIFLTTQRLGEGCRRLHVKKHEYPPFDAWTVIRTTEIPEKGSGSEKPVQILGEGDDQVNQIYDQ